MYREWSMRRLVTVALLASYALFLPVVVVIFWRLRQIYGADVTDVAGIADLATRDVTVLVAMWLLGAVALLVWSRRNIVRPALRLQHALERIADGDFDTRVPVAAGGEMKHLALALQLAVDRFDRRDRLKVQKIVELRSLAERLVETVDQPVLVVGVDGTIDYANETTERLFGEANVSLAGTELDALPGGKILRDTVDTFLGTGDASSNRDVDGIPRPEQSWNVECAVVRDGAGVVARVVIVLAPTNATWWQRLFTSPDEAEQTS